MNLLTEIKRKYRKIYYMQLVSSLFLVLAGCGGGGGDAQNNESTMQTGFFLDSAVEGVNYDAMPSGVSGQTDASGKFGYFKHDVVSFSIGDIILGSAYGEGSLTPINFDPNSRESYTQKVLNIVRLLQSLDIDDNPANGITLPPDIHSLASGLSLDLSQPSIDFENDAAVMVLTNGSGLIPEEEALAHFRGTMQALSISILQGNYNLTGTSVTDLQGNDLLPPGNTFSGSMTISSEGIITQTIYVNGQLVVDPGGTAEIYDHYRFLVTSGECTYYVNYSYIPGHPGLGTEVDTSEPTADGSQTIGECLGLQPGNDFIEYDHWI